MLPRGSRLNPLTQTLDLVRKAQGGDRDALDRLFSRYYERVRRSVRARIGARLRSKLESGDILQQAFAKAFETFDRFEMRHEGSFLHWLAEIAVRQIGDAADHFGAGKRLPPSPLMSLQAEAGDASGQLGDVVAGAQTGPDGRSMRNEQEAAVEACMDQLPEEYRRVLVLRDYDGLEWREVAEVLGKNTDSAAREQHRRALLELSRCLRRRGIGPSSP
jgi:RNA polymerase sigma-70 factor (ECF subfamily)